MSHPRAVKRSIESYTETEKLERDTELAKKEEEARITLELLLTRNKRARSSSGSDEGDIALLTSPSTSGSVRIAPALVSFQSLQLTKYLLFSVADCLIPQPTHFASVS